MKKLFFPGSTGHAVPALALAAALTVSGCSAFSEHQIQVEYNTAANQGTLSTDTGSSLSSDAAAEQSRFEDFLTRKFREGVQDDSLLLHFLVRHPENFGITESEAKFSEYSLEQLQQKSAENTAALEELFTFNTDLLTSDQLLTYRMMKDFLETESLSNGLEIYNQPLGRLIGIQAELPTLLAEYAFYSRDDIENYLKLLSQIDTYYEQLAKYEQTQADSGVGLSDEILDRIIKSCKSYLIRPENSLLTETFSLRLDDVPDLSNSEKAAYKAKHLSIMKEHFIPAYTNLSKTLESLKGSTPETGGLATYEHGKEYYGYLVSKLTGTDSTVDELKTRISNQLQTDLSEIRVRLKENPDLARQMTDSAITLSDPDEILQNLQTQIQDDFPMSSELSYTIKYIPESLESSLSPAFYLVPPVDSDDSDSIYINAKAGTEQNLYGTLAHEGYPGHLYQFAYSNDHGYSPMRRLIACGGYNEGWGLYSELYAYSFDNGLPEDVKPLMSCSKAANYGLYALLDICIHYNGWDLETTTDYLKNSYGFTDPEAAKEMYLSILDNPGNYLKYYTGYLEILTMRQKAEDILGSHFNIRDFHQFILDMNGASFRVIKPYFETWLMVKQLDLPDKTH